MEEVKKSISVITVCYNCRKQLVETIESVLSQTYKNIEYIVVDGGSTDGTKDILAQYADNIDVCISEPDDGIYDAMNKGIRNSTSEWVLFMNAGDRFHDNQVLQNIFSSDISDETEFLYSDYYMRCSGGKEYLWKTNRDAGIVHHQSAIYRRRLHNVYGYYIVTHPYIVSDLMFFLAVPKNKYKKVEWPIAAIDGEGISAGLWSRKQSLCLRYIYGIIPFKVIFKDWIRMNIGAIFRKMRLL